MVPNNGKRSVEFLELEQIVLILSAGPRRTSHNYPSQNATQSAGRACLAAVLGMASAFPPVVQDVAEPG
jgi:hypothetical protein